MVRSREMLTGFPRLDRPPRHAQEVRKLTLRTRGLDTNASNAVGKLGGLRTMLVVMVDRAQPADR
jgi:hypothetical protein